MVDLGGLNQNTWRKLQKLVSAWEKARASDTERDQQPPEPPPTPVTKPS